MSTVTHSELGVAELNLGFFFGGGVESLTSTVVATRGTAAGGN